MLRHLFLTIFMFTSTSNFVEVLSLATTNNFVVSFILTEPGARDHFAPQNIKTLLEVLPV